MNHSPIVARDAFMQAYDILQKSNASMDTARVEHDIIDLVSDEEYGHMSRKLCDDITKDMPHDIDAFWAGTHPNALSNAWIFNNAESLPVARFTATGHAMASTAAKDNIVATARCVYLWLMVTTINPDLI